MIDPKLREITLRNFKSIEEGTVEISDTGVLIGRNNSGKSNVIEGFKAVQEILPLRKSEPLGSQWDTRFYGKETSKNIHISLTFEISDEYHEEKIEELSEDPYNTNKRTLNKLEDSTSLSKIKLEIEVRDTSKRERNREFFINFDGEWVGFDDINRKIDFERGTMRDAIEDSIRTWEFVAPFREIEDVLNAKYTEELSSGGHDLIQVLNSLQSNHSETFQKIAAAYVDIMDGVEDISIEFDRDASSASAKTIMVKETGFSEKFDAGEISSGSKEILVLLTQIYLASDRYDVLFLEEPELHLHPGAEQKVYSIIQDIVQDTSLQFVISTHSDVFVDQSEAGSLTRVARDGGTKLRGIEPGKIDVELKDLGYDKSGLLQAEAVVFTEGRSDKLILKEFAKTVGLNPSELGIEFVELEGIANMLADAKSLVKLLYSFDIPYLFIRDRHDKAQEAARGELYDAMTRDDDNQWWKTSMENILVWDAYGIEEFLMKPHVISDVIVELSEERVSEIIEEYDSESDKGVVLRALAAEEYEDADSPEAFYDKDRDGLQIAKSMQPKDFDDQVIQCLEEIGNLVNEKPVLD